MMNRGVLQRQMFAKGGAAFPDMSGDGKVTQKDVLMARGVLPRPMQMGGEPTMPPMPQEAAGIASMAVPAQQQVDPAILEQMLAQAGEGIGDLENVESYEQMMNMMRGDEASIPERREELAGLVGPEDAAQTPESVLALVQPIVQIASVDQGIGGLAQEQMTESVEGPMAEGIMSTMAPAPAPAAPGPMMEAGSPPPVNFNQGGLVRRGDNQPVQYYAPGGPVKPVVAEAGRLGELYEQKLPLYQGIIGDQSASLADQKRLTQAQMLFDLASTGLAFAAPMQGERSGLSPAERLAMAAQQTQLPEKIGARAQQQLEREQAATTQQQQMKLSALTAAESSLAAEAKAAAELKQTEIKGAQKIAEITLEDKLASASAQALESQRQTGSVDLENVKQKNREMLEGIVQTNRVAIETLRQTGSQENIILADKLEKENIELRGNIELGRMQVANEYDIAKMDKAHEQATELQDSRLKVQKSIADNQLELDTINSALNQARADKELAIKESNLALAQQTEARIKSLEEQKLALDTRKVDLEAAAQNLNQFGTSVDGRIMNIITGKGVFQPDETASMLADRYARGETLPDEDIVLNQAIEYFVAPKPVWDAENKRYTLSEGNTLAQEWRQAIEKRKAIEGKTVPTLGGPVTTSQTDVVTPQGTGAASSVIENLNATAGDVPSFDERGQPIDIKDTTYNSIIAGLDPTLATGQGSAYAQALNRTAEILLPVFGKPFPETSRAISVLANLNTTTSAALLAAQPGREAEAFRQDILKTLPKTASFTKGDESAYDEIRNTVAYLNQEINSLYEERKKPVSEARLGQLDKSIFQLTAIRDTYAQIGRGYEVRSSGSGDRPPIESFDYLLQGGEK